MKKMTFLFLLLFHLHSFGQTAENSLPTKPFVILKDGSMISVKKPVVVCENRCYYINKSTNETQQQDIAHIEGFSKGSDVRWITPQEFQKIGKLQVQGFFWGVVMIYPSGFGICMLSDLIKRKHIQKMYLNGRFGTNVKHS